MVLEMDSGPCYHFGESHYEMYVTPTSCSSVFTLHHYDMSARSNLLGVSNVIQWRCSERSRSTTGQKLRFTVKNVNYKM
jgi:hypothetical protein